MLINNFMKSFGVDANLNLYTDASAAVGIAQRQGSGRVKHLQCRQLWIQEKLGNKELAIIKIPREINGSDLLTHHWNAREANLHFQRMGI